MGGIFFNTIAIYDPTTKTEVSSEHTFLPLVVGLVLFSIGVTVKRYDEIHKDFLKTNPS